MKCFVQFDSSGREIARFHLSDPDDNGTQAPVGSFPLSDICGEYCVIGVGELVRFSGTTTLKRVA